ncbi:MAG: carboxymuconolactone decarboxylase family protein [Gammaproteobacteria bacterium]
MTAKTTPRLPLLTREQMSPEAVELLDKLVINDGGKVRKRTPDDPVSPFYGAVLQAPRLFKDWSWLGGALLRPGGLPVRDRELVCLRTAWLCQGEMEWGNHVVIAHDIGMTPEEIERITHGPDRPEWSARDRAVLRGVDELHFQGTLLDPTWAALAAVYDAQQLIEYLMLVGNYHTTAYVQNALRIPLEEGIGGLDSR